MNGSNVTDIIPSAGHQLRKTVDAIGDEISVLNIKPDRIGRVRFVGFCEVSSNRSVKSSLRETLAGCCVAGVLEEHTRRS